MPQNEEFMERLKAKEMFGAASPNNLDEMIRKLGPIGPSRLKALIDRVKESEVRIAESSPLKTHV